MDEIDAKSVRSGLKFFDFPNPLEGPVVPRFNVFEPNYEIGFSTSEISIGLGFKTFVYSGPEPKCSNGDLIKINSLSETIYGEMSAMVHTYSYDDESGIATIVVEVYYSDMKVVTIPFENKWIIAFQLNDGSNIVQNPNSPYLAKLSVWENSNFPCGAGFFMPHQMTQTQNVITSDTPYLYAGYQVLEWKKRINITEDMSDIHQPWLGTKLKLRLKFRKTTYVEVDERPDPNPTVEYSYRDYEHTFSSFDFDPMSSGFVAGIGHSPSRCETVSSYIDSYTNTFSIVRDPTRINPQVATYVINEFVFGGLVEEEIGIIEITPPSFFEPPFAP